MYAEYITYSTAHIMYAFCLEIESWGSLKIHSVS